MNVQTVTTAEGYEAIMADTKELVSEVHLLTLPVLQAVAETKLRMMDEGSNDAQSLFKHLTDWDVHALLDAIDGLETLKQSMQYFTSVNLVNTSVIQEKTTCTSSRTEPNTQSFKSNTSHIV
ncbi:hypothetical protein AAGS61_02135 [Lysinibacillus sp. KU-BSD001]|uniref:hypothetical protein n=1 Tax=Lysinibacillus sp. KU-BSD001 TaxID=3141328 RepID=UPI0036EFCDCE